MSIADVLKKYSQLPGDRLCIVEPGASIRSLTGAVVFVLAVWSGPAIVALRELSAHLASDPNAPLPLRIVDADEVTDGLIEELGARPHGKGEVFWVKDGRVVASMLTWTYEHAAEGVRRNNAAIL